jgi:hypothetical protein
MWFGSSWSTSSVRLMDRNLAIRGGSANTPTTVCSRARRLFGGCKVSGCSHGLVGRRSDISGGVEEAAAGWFGERDELVGRDLLWGHPPHSFKPAFALFDGDFGFALGSHGDHPGRSSQTRVISGDVPDHVCQLDAVNQAAVQGHDGGRQINPAGDHIRSCPAGLGGDRCADGGAKLAGRLN